MEEHNNNSGRPPGGGDDNKNPRNRQTILMFLIVALVGILFWNFVGNMGASSKEITYNEFLDMLEKEEVESVEITSSQINIVSKEKDAMGREVTFYTGIVPDYYLQERLDAAGVEYDAPVTDFRTVVLSAIVNFLLPILVLWGVFALIMRRMGGGGGMMGMNVGKSKAKGMPAATMPTRTSGNVIRL